MNIDGLQERRQLCASDREHQVCPHRGQTIMKPFALICDAERLKYAECSCRDINGVQTHINRRKLGQDVGSEF